MQKLCFSTTPLKGSATETLAHTGFSGLLDGFAPETLQESSVPFLSHIALLSLFLSSLVTTVFTPEPYGNQSFSMTSFDSRYYDKAIKTLSDCYVPSWYSAIPLHFG